MTGQKISQFCDFENCRTVARTRGYCGKHYRLLREENALSQVRFDNFEQSFWSKVGKGEDENECWKWNGGTDKDGYGRIRVNGRKENAHCLSFYLHNGFWSSKYILHSCDNPPCCNPKHLREGTAKENSAEMVQRGRWKKGVKTIKESVKDLSAKQIDRIKGELKRGWLASAIAKRNNTTVSVVRAISSTQSLTE